LIVKSLVGEGLHRRAKREREKRSLRIKTAKVLAMVAEERFDCEVDLKGGKRSERLLQRETSRRNDVWQGRGGRNGTIYSNASDLSQKEES